MDEIEIQLFEADTKASRGITADHLDDAINGFDADRNPVPVVRGHPSNDAPAHGKISALRREGGKLFGKVKNLSSEIVDDVKAGRILNRSIAFWSPTHPSNPNPGKLSLRHLGMLGAGAPGIPNMDPLTFSADNDTLGDNEPPAPAVMFGTMDGDAATPVVSIDDGGKATNAKAIADAAIREAQNSHEEGSMTEEEIKAANDKLAADQKAHDEAVAAFAAEKAAARTEAHTTFAASLVEAGRLPAGHKDNLVKALDAMPTETLEFAATEGDKTVEESPGAFMMRLLGGAKPVVDLSADPKSPTDPAGEQFGADGDDDEAKALAKANADQQGRWRGDK